MLEVAPLDPSVIACLSTSDHLDRLPQVEGFRRCRISPGEVYFVGRGSGRRAGVEEIRERLLPLDPDALVVDLSDGWTGWSLRGGAAEEVFARLSVLALPDERPAFLQGAVAQVPAKVLLDEGKMLLLVPAPVEHHLRERIRTAGADLEVAFAERGGRG